MGQDLSLLSNQAKLLHDKIAPGERVAQFYANDDILLDTLTEFVGSGLNAGESAIVVATPEHLRALRQRLVAADVDLMRAMFDDRYIMLDAHVALSTFMIGGWPDDRLFAKLAGNLLGRASVHNRRVRVFGEMVALLWANGQPAATVHLERLWSRFCESHSLSLFCAYPKAGFTGDSAQALAEICATHTRVI
jgi:MEDS: MEthanogen/methylotroph, DcmR Sensory domain